MKYIRKAVVAGVLATGTALVVGLKTEIPQTDEGWAALIGGAIVSGVLAGFATWRVRNAPTPPDPQAMRYRQQP
jgi:hypothetical protein